MKRALDGRSEFLSDGRRARRGGRGARERGRGRVAAARARRRRRRPGGPDAEAAFEWFRKAATAPDAPIPSLHELGLCYLRGLGTAADGKQGVEWLTAAALLGHKQAAIDLRNYYTSIDLDAGALEVLAGAAGRGATS